MAGFLFALQKLRLLCSGFALALVSFCAQSMLADDAPSASYRQLLSLFTQREYGQVIANVERLHVHTPIALEELQSIYLAAESYFAIGNYQRSKEYIDFWLANYTSSGVDAIAQLEPYCKFRLAQIYCRLDDNEKSEQILKQLLSVHLPAPLEASVSLQLAWLTAEVDPASADARSLCDKCLSLSKPNSQDHLSALLLHAVLSRRADGDQKAREILSAVRKECGESEQFQELRYKATVFLLQIENAGGDQAGRSQLVQELKTMRPPNQRLLELAKLESMLAARDEASVSLKLRELTTLGQTARDPQVRQRSLLALIRIPDLNDSHQAVIECCSKLLKNESLSEELKAEITFRLANAQCKSDRMQEAVELLSKSVNSLPSDSPWKLPSLLLLAETSFQIEKLPLSRKTFSKLVEDSKMSQSAEIRYLATLRLGEIAAIENDWLLADQFASGLRQATDCFTYEAATNYLFGRISVTKGEFDEARSQLSQAVKSAGKETEIAARAQWLIGETYFLQNNYSMALQNYAAVLHYDDQPQWCAVSQLQAAKCLEAQGNWTDAVAAYQRAIEAYPDSIYVDETLQRLQTAQKSAATHIAEVESKNTR